MLVFTSIRAVVLVFIARLVRLVLAIDRVAIGLAIVARIVAITEIYLLAIAAIIGQAVVISFVVKDKGML